MPLRQLVLLVLGHISGGEHGLYLPYGNYPDGTYPVGWTLNYYRDLTSKRILVWGADVPRAVAFGREAVRRCAHMLLVVNNESNLEHTIEETTEFRPVVGVCPPNVEPIVIGTTGAVADEAFHLGLTFYYKDLGGPPDMTLNFGQEDIADPVQMPSPWNQYHLHKLPPAIYHTWPERT
mmetsp:Transcript_25345/g.45893  ORF Transcript_25345/g.45893 Transcript_25345/m.45893 type:complete len:178 (-) Transcript_25345:85-618(-)